jgi:hypothetical protein
LVYHHYLQGLSFLARSVLKHLWGLWVTLFYLSRFSICCKTPIVEDQVSYSGFPSLRQFACRG